MKKLFTSILAVAAVIFTSPAQSHDAMTRFLTQLESLHEEMVSAFNNDDRSSMESICMSMIVLYDQQPGNVKSATKAMMGSVWYNVSCLRSLRGDIEGALEAMAEAVTHGWDNYTYTMNDPDLESVRNDPRFTDIISSIKR